MKVNRGWFLLVILLGQLVSCQSSPDPSPTASPIPTTEVPTFVPTPDGPAINDLSLSLRGEVRIWLSWDASELKSLDQVIMAFQTYYPEITLALVYYPFDALQDAVERIGEGGEAPSILFAPASWGPWLWKSELVQDISSRVDSELRVMVHPLAWSQTSIQEALIALPIELFVVALYRNRTLANEPAATLEEWVEISNSLKDDDIVGTALDFGFPFSASLLSTCGGKLFAEDGKLAFNGPEGVCWLDLLAFLRGAGRVTFNTDDDLILFETGLSAWLMDSSENARRLAQAFDNRQLVIDPWPLYQETGERMAGFVWTENVYLMENLVPVDLEVSWTFARFLLTPEVQLMLSDPQGAGHLPTLANLELTDEQQTQLLATLSSGVAYPLRDDLDFYAEHLEGAVRSVTLSGADPEFALEMTMAKIEQDKPADETGE